MTTSRDAQSFARTAAHLPRGGRSSQEALAERADLSARGLSDLERGLSRAPRLHTLSQLAEALALSPADREALLRASGRLSQSDVGDAPAPACRPVRRARLPDAGCSGATASGRVARLSAPRRVRLVTLVGPGGVGKTRLAVHDRHVATARLRFPTASRSPRWRRSAIRPSCWRRSPRPSASAKPAMRRSRAASSLALRSRRMLLILDNCEHVLEAAPIVADVMCAAAAACSVLATSRARLRIQGEHVFLVRPLPRARAGDTSAEDTRAWPSVVAVRRARPGRPTGLRSDR